MKPHHAAALALIGWFLMIPPQICPKNPYSQVPRYRDPSVSLNNGLVPIISILLMLAMIGCIP